MVSTLVELFGFACAVVCAFLFGDRAGFAVAALSLLTIGYGLEDDQAVLRLQRVTWALKARRTRRKAARGARRTRQGRGGDQGRR